MSMSFPIFLILALGIVFGLAVIIVVAIVVIVTSNKKRNANSPQQEHVHPPQVQQHGSVPQHQANQPQVHPSNPAQPQMNQPHVNGTNTQPPSFNKGGQGNNPQ